MLVLAEVSKTYARGVQALSPTSLTVESGRVTVLLGPSGAGKSTLLRCMNMLVRPTTGTVKAEGLPALESRRALREHRRQTGMVFQHHQLIPRYTALRNVLLGRVAYHPFLRGLLPACRGDLDIALKSLDQVGLLDKSLERADHLSGGEQQRVGIARALAQQPRLILADEPVASLDPGTARRVMTLLRRVCEQNGITLVASLHQVDLALLHADRIVGLAHGSIVYDGPPADVSDRVLRLIYDDTRRGSRDSAPISGDDTVDTPDVPIRSTIN
ncbi:phosphonate ABC transporter ATP-binding protein [Mycobacteroides abscessus]|uniref:phosphonate ABC transporter ATP-binding protein n=1 Tax=Mycobacteroides abscessus TaxID=36809 RepID=UPI0009A88394|nr:phosphonate ABC transporter ATP-binding protein [Mycobacteroides abscessus]SKW95002.1 phosphonate ABC transporter ATPase [Mycobacteroides abscessus subsp. abscessus]SKY36240.1 phosphonate ABC transporter ATPase [Mycobacteroides abscessus subsp. abscessus]SKZ33585.1 phosphonate ABC transporter ATPase [Mycobacteroides abscessus subsp. abscessus]SKZ78027.1 phosphonate ABC transporter ATPase [Mycobacteroides abscessus subsp. abscessus]SKZ93209.1 phosphonate ABC transporter ATPase [Mycobacteroid